MSKIKIAPSILSADFSKMAKEVISLQDSGADLIHCDVMDGVFVKNITFGPKMVVDIKKHTTLELDCHLMIVNPQNYIKNFADAGADYITVHYEACKENLAQTLEEIKKLNVKCGAVINPNTPPSAIKDVLHLCDMVLVMSVYPGFGGQKFIESALDSLSQLRQMIDNVNPNILLQIDGGINFENVNSVIAHGANVIVAGNTVFSSPERSAAIQKLRGF